MSEFYGDEHRALQARFETRKLADRLEEAIIQDRVGDAEQRFLESRDMFFLSTVDPRGRPTVSYKGGDPGFVRVLDPKTLVFPSFDGNGMFYSMGNLAGTSHIGMLFIDFETPHRLRLQGRASIDEKDPLRDAYPKADLVVRVEVDQLWVNCPRYIHRYQKLERSKYVPREDGEAPMPQWKRIDVMQDVLPGRDLKRREAEGETITLEEYGEKIKSGEA